MSHTAASGCRPGPGYMIYTLGLAFFVLLPILALFAGSLRDESGGFPLARLAGLALDSRQLGLMQNSLLLSAGAAGLATLVGVPLALLLFKTDLPGRNFFRIACLAPLLMPPYLHAIVWAWISSPDNLIAAAEPQAWWQQMPTIYSLPGCIVVFALSFFPLVMLITGAGLQAVAAEMEEAALLVRNGPATLARVTLALVRPHIVASGILVFVFSLVNFEVPDILRVHVFPVEIFINFSAYGDELTAALLSLPLITVAMLLVWIQMRLMRHRSYLSTATRSRTQPPYRLGRYRRPLACLPLVVLLVSTVTPLTVMAANCGALRQGWTVFAASAGEFAYSLATAAIAALLLTALAAPAAYYLVRGRGRLRTWLDFIIQIPFGVPSIVLGIGMIQLWNRACTGWIYDSALMLVIAYFTAYSPFAVKIIAARMQQIEPEMEEAALLAGRGRLATFIAIVMPAAAPGLAAAFVVGFVLSLANLGAALLVTPPGHATMPVTMYNFLHYGSQETVFAQGLILVSLAFGVILLARPLSRLPGYCCRWAFH